MEELIRELTHIGLSEKEAQVYLSALELGPAVVQDISKKASVNRATTYVMIESLASRGLMSTFVKGKKRFFSAETPERLLSIVRLQRRELEEKEKEVMATLPKLQALHNLEGARPQIRYLEGTEGVHTVREIFQVMEGEFIEIVPVQDAENLEEIMQHREAHIHELRKRGASYRTLAVMDTPDFSKIPKLEGGEIRIIPTDKFPIHGEIVVRGHTTFMYSYKSNLLGVVVTSKEIAETIKAMFDLAWTGAASYPSEKR